MAEWGIHQSDSVPRRAGITDAAAIARVHVAAWQAGYSGIIPDSALAGIGRHRTDRWTRVLAREAQEPDRAETYVIEDEHGTITGISMIGAAREENDPALGELWMLNVAPEAWGTGLATILHGHVLQRLRESGFGEAILWVLRQNARARRFYEREGWQPDGGTKVESLRGHACELVRYRIGLCAQR